MKSSRFIAIMVLGIALCATPIYAQRGGGGSRGGGSYGGGSRGGGYSSMGSSSRGGGSVSHSSSSSRSSYSGSSSSRGSSHSYSSPSSSYSRSSSHSYSSPSSSRSSSGSSHSTYSGSSSSSRSNYSGSSSSSNSYSRPAPRSNYSGGSYSGPRGNNTSVGRGSSTNGAIRGTYSGSRNTPGPRGEINSYRGTDQRATRDLNGNTIRRPSNGNDVRPGSGASRTEPASATRGEFKGHGGPTDGPRGGAYSGYARPGRPGGHIPPADRHMHPAPYFHHPHHHGMIHMHPIYWDPFPPRAWYWPGFWGYCNSYWYDYHVTDVVVVREYVNENYNLDMVDFAVSGDIMYALVRSEGKTYVQVYSNEDKLLAEQVVNKKYNKLEIDKENGGCWIFKNNDKDPLLFIYTGTELLIYEADE